MKVPDGLARAGFGTFRHLPAAVRRQLVRWWAPSYTVGVICVVVDGDRVLLVRHSYRRDWGAPGGLLDRGELPEHAAGRETLEEVGLDIVLDDGPIPVVWPRYRRLDLVYASRPAPGADVAALVPSSPEIVEVRWHGLGALPPLQPDTSEALRALRLLSERPRRTRSEAPSERRDGGAW